MRIGLVVPGFSADDRDWCIPALRHLARALASHDELRVIAVRYPYVARRYTVDAVETIALGGALSHGQATLGLWRDALNLLADEHRRRPFDVLHAFWATESGLLTTLAGRLLRIPTLVSLAGGELVSLRDIQYGDQRLAGERAKVAASLRLASAVSAGSRLLVGTAERHLRGRRRVHLAPLGVDLQLFTPAPVARQTCPRLVHVAGLTPVKDQVTLLRAFARLRRANAGATLDIVGDGPQHGRLEQLAHELGVDDHVIFRGEIDHASLPEVYRAARAFVLSSRHEAQSIVALEAAACGLTPAGTRVGVLPELTAAVVPVSDDAGLAQAMAAALDADSPTTHVVGAKMRDRFGLQACTDRFRELYVHLV